MLDDLDQIDWSQLSHAYGAASDVPELIRQLMDGSSEVRETALADLFSTIWHQGTVYDATSHAVPFLIELVTDTTLPDRSHVLYLLHAIAEGWLDCQRYAAERERKKFVSAETAERHARERIHYQAAHSAVARGLTSLLNLLSDEQVEVRVWAAFVASVLIDQAGEVAEALLDAIDREADNFLPFRPAVCIGSAYYQRQ